MKKNQNLKSFHLWMISIFPWGLIIATILSPFLVLITNIYAGQVFIFAWFLGTILIRILISSLLKKAQSEKSFKN